MADPNANDDPGLLSDDEIEARQRAEDDEAAGHNPEVGKDATTTDADTDAATAAAAAPAADGAAPDTAPAGDAAAAPAAGADPKDITGKPEGVLSKDGSRVLPYSALQAERRSARSATARAQRLEQELNEAQQLIADMKAGKTPDTGEVTEEQVAEMEANFPEQGKLMRTLFERAKTAAPSTPGKAQDADEPGDDPAQEAIDQIPLLLDWQHGDPEKFGRAIEHDALLMRSPKWAEKPVIERFAEAARRTADEYDIAFEQPTKASTTAAPPAAKATTAAQDAARKTLESLSDFKGGSIVDHGSIDPTRASPQALLNRMLDMSDEQMDAHLAKYG